jgi:hypothetical protein
LLVDHLVTKRSKFFNDSPIQVDIINFINEIRDELDKYVAHRKSIPAAIKKVKRILLSKEELAKLEGINLELKGKNNSQYQLKSLEKLSFMEKETLQNINEAVTNSAEISRKMLVNVNRFIKNEAARHFWDENFATVHKNSLPQIKNYSKWT